MFGSQNNGPEPADARTWRARISLMNVLTGRTWPYRGLDHKGFYTRQYVLQKFWQDSVTDKFGRRDEIPPNEMEIPKSVSSCAMTVMDKVEGWNEQQWVGSKFAACMWLYIAAVLCDGQEPTQEHLRWRLSIIRECVSWVCEDVLWEHEWVTEFNVFLNVSEILEVFNYDLDVPCSIQWGLLWLSSPSRLGQKFTTMARIS